MSEEIKEQSVEEKKEEGVVETGAEVAEEKKAKIKRRKKGAKNVPVGNAFVKATFNNTMMTITDLAGNVVASASAGVLGFSGTKKSTPYVAGLIAGNAVNKAKAFGMTDVNVYVKGIGSGRESAVRAIQSSGLNILTIKDQTPLPHNGCRRKRARRV